MVQEFKSMTWYDHIDRGKYQETLKDICICKDFLEMTPKIK